MIQYLFFDCRFMRMVWASVYAAWGISKPRNMANMFGSRLNRVPKDFKPLVGATTLCWSVWLCRNGAVFDNKQSSFLQVVFSTMHWLRTWAILQRPSSQEVLVETYLFWLRWPRYFLLGHMGGSLVLGLTAIRVSGLLSSSFRLWAVPAEIGNISR